MSRLLHLALLRGLSGIVHTARKRVQHPLRLPQNGIRPRIIDCMTYSRMLERFSVVGVFGAKSEV
jgi:hypothetical protein